MSRVWWIRSAVIAAIVASSWIVLRAWEGEASKGRADESPRRSASDGAEPSRKRTGNEPRREALLEEWNARRREDAEKGAAIRQALLRKTNVDAPETPLVELLQNVLKDHPVPFVIDEKALTDEGVDLNQPVSLHVDDVTLRSALRLMLEPLNLTWIIRDEVLTITTVTVAGDIQEVRIYEVRKLVEVIEDDPESNDFTVLTEVITSCIGPDSWDEGTGPGPIRELDVAQSIVLRQTAAIHDEMAALLTELERNVGTPPGQAPPPPAPDPIRKAEETLRLKLKKHCDLVVNAESLEQVVQRLAQQHQFPFWPDLQSLADEGTAYDQKVTANLQDVRLETALNHLLRPLQLTWVIEDEVIKLTTVTRANDKLVVRVYPVGDFLPPKAELHWPPFDYGRRDWPGLGAGLFSTPVIHLRQGFGAAGSDDCPPSMRRHDEGKPDLSELIELITSALQPDTWDEVGGPGTIRDMRDVIVVRQTQAIHEEIETLLATLRDVIRRLEGQRAKPQPPDPDELTLYVYPLYDYSPAELAKLIPEVVAPESWKSAGGKGTMYVQPAGLVIRQTRAVHKEIVKLLYDVVLNRKQY